MSNKLKIISLGLIILGLISFTKVHQSATEYAYQETDVNAVYLNNAPEQYTNTKNNIESENDGIEFVSYDIPLDEEIQRYIFDKCNEYEVDFELVLGVMQAESNFTDGLTSSAGCIGLMQVNPQYWEFYTPIGTVNNADDLLDAYINIEAGIYQLSYLSQKYESANEILMCYNLGEYGASKYFDDGIFKTAYTDKVNSNIDNLQI